jgi:hypothetical protein
LTAYSRGAEERFEPKMLLDLFEEQLDLQVAAVNLRDRERGQDEIVGKKDQRLDGLGILEANTPLRCSGALARVEARKDDGLVEDQPGCRGQRDAGNTAGP